MRLNAAVVVFVFSLTFLFLSSGAAFALDGIDLSHPPQPVEDGACSRLVQIKYPFLNCESGEIGLANDGESWANRRQIPIMSDWTEGEGAWGPDLNPSSM